MVGVAKNIPKKEETLSVLPFEEFLRNRSRQVQSPEDLAHHYTNLFPYENINEIILSNIFSGTFRAEKVLI